MIIWFSGTGNSEWVAEQLASALGERMVSVAEGLTSGDTHLTLHDGERLGFVFPTYSWGPPPVVTEFVEKIQITGTPSSCFMVTTCGDDIGLSVPIMAKALSRRGFTLLSAHSVQMPNNYINMKGFDVDSDAVSKTQSRPQPTASSGNRHCRAKSGDRCGDRAIRMGEKQGDSPMVSEKRYERQEICGRYRCMHPLWCMCEELPDAQHYPHRRHPTLERPLRHVPLPRPCHPIRQIHHHQRPLLF